jgi:hypothetical protein
MPFCPLCRAEYREGFTLCADCYVELVDELPPDEEESARQRVKDVPVATFPTQTEAEMWAELLRRDGIPTVLVSLGPGAGAWGNSVFVPHQLRVREADIRRARRLLPRASLVRD